MSDTMKKFNQLLQDLVNKPYEELLELAKMATAKAMDFFAQFDKENNGAEMVLPVIFTILASDGKFTALEYQFLKDLVGDVNFDKAKTSIQAFYSDEWEASVDELIDACSKDMKSNLLLLVTCVAAVDETITVDEQRYIAKLLA